VTWFKITHLNADWQVVFNQYMQQQNIAPLNQFLKEQYHSFNCFPPKGQIFNAFNLCAFQNLKVVIIGQDPYHGKGQANGLAFSVNDGIAHPPSLINIFKELNSDLGIVYPKSGDLSPWASQGVLLLNATLTVRTAEAASHQKQGWEIFTDKVIETISTNNNGIVFLLWGGYAQKKKKLIDAQRHLVLESGHPSPMSANRGYWFGNRHFSKCNAYLKSKGNTPIDWHLD
jgi:uracil-DNA glycosylase